MEDGGAHNVPYRTVGAGGELAAGRPRALIPGLLLAVGLAVATAVAPAASARADDVQPVVRLQDPRITESSGLAASLLHPGVAWTLNDSGDSARLFAVDLQTGATLATVRLAGAPARDWEALAAVREPDGTAVLWVGDIGDNNGVWPFVRLYRVEEPARLHDSDIEWTAYRVRYADGPRDAEALLADPASGRLSLVTKSVSGAGVYRLPARLVPTPELNRAERVADAPGLVTDAGYSPDGRRIAWASYVDGWLSDSVGGAATVVRMPVRRQGESLTWTPDASAVLVGTEGSSSGIWRVMVSPTAAAPSTASTAPSYGPVGNGMGDGSTQSVPYWTVGAMGAMGAMGALGAIGAGVVLGGGVRWLRRRRRRSRDG